MRPCQQCYDWDRTDFSFTRGTEASHPTFTLNATTVRRNSGSSQPGSNGVMVLGGRISAESMGSSKNTGKNYWKVGMSTSTAKTQDATALRVKVTRDTLSVELSDGRTISAPLAWYPRLTHGTTEEKNRWRLIGKGHGIHWPDLDEDISVANLLAGSPSVESQTSFQRWLSRRSDRSAKRRAARPSKAT